MYKLLIIFLFIFFTSISANAASEEKNKYCSGGMYKWTEDGEFKEIRKPKNCVTEEQYQAYLKQPDYLCKYYVKSIWKESERAYGKKQYKYTPEKLIKIKALKEEGKALCDAGKLKEGEAKLVEALTIISFTQMN